MFLKQFQQFLNFWLIIAFQEVTERHDAVMSQLMSGDVKNQNIPGKQLIPLSYNHEPYLPFGSRYVSCIYFR